MNASASNRNSSAEAGFTLVEIAIVLVIIGLLLGGILKGQEMITQAKIKNVVNDFNGITVAVTSYQDRYRFLPGDDKGATARWTTPASGDGDGVILGKYNATTAGATPTGAEESNLFWQHLRLAGFVPGVTTGAGTGTQPLNAAGGMIGVQNAVTAGIGLGFTGLTICSANIPDKVASAVDIQMDDGNSQTGQVRAQLGGSTPDLGTTAATSYVETGVNQYLVCKMF